MNDFEGNKKMFWKEVKCVRKGEQARDKLVKDVNGEMLCDGVDVRRRWAHSEVGPECGICQGGNYQCDWQMSVF